MRGDISWENTPVSLEFEDLADGQSDKGNVLSSRGRSGSLLSHASESFKKVTDSIKSSAASAKKPAEDVGYVAIGFEIPQDFSEEEEEKDQDSFWSFGENSTPQRVEAWCSWCLRKGEHALVDKGYLSRSQFKCGLCSMPTVMCKLSSKSFKDGGNYPCGFARSHADGAEDHCLVCAQVLSEWRPELLITLDKVAFCSGCKRNSRHSFVKNAPKQQRDQYRCQGCSRRTFPCSSCDSGMTLKGLPGLDLMNTRCLRCNEEETAGKNGGKTQKRLSIPSLPSMARTNPFADPGLVVDRGAAQDAETRKLPDSVQSWCSWCDHFEYHHLAKPKDTSGTSGSGLLSFMPKSKQRPATPKYLCGGCMSPTLPCVTCKLGMARLLRSSSTSLFSKQCARCQEGGSKKLPVNDITSTAPLPPPGSPHPQPGPVQQPFSPRPQARAPETAVLEPLLTNYKPQILPTNEARLSRYDEAEKDPALRELPNSDIQETLDFLEQEASVLRNRRSFQGISNPYGLDVGIELDDSEEDEPDIYTPRFGRQNRLDEGDLGCSAPIHWMAVAAAILVHGNKLTGPRKSVAQLKNFREVLAGKQNVPNDRCMVDVCYI